MNSEKFMDEINNAYDEMIESPDILVKIGSKFYTVSSVEIDNDGDIIIDASLEDESE